MKKSVADLKAAIASEQKPVSVLKSSAPKASSDKAPATPKKRKPIGRPPVADKRSVKVTLSLTKHEALVLKEKAGMVPQAAFLLAKLHETDCFKD